jgi:hypothetical protein
MLGHNGPVSRQREGFFYERFSDTRHGPKSAMRKHDTLIARVSDAEPFTHERREPC